MTYSILTDESDPERPFYGVATTFFSTLKAGDRIQVATRRTAKATFRLPLDAENTPLLMFSASTRRAPFKSFIEQRAIQLEANSKTKLARAHLILGCRHSERDRLYADQMDKWAELGAVTVLYAFSQEPDKSDGCKHVDDRMRKEVETLVNSWAAGSRAYICRNRAFAESVQATARNIVEERIALRRQEGNWTDEQVEQRKKEIFGSFSDRAADDGGIFL
jgi:cytochrome P450/NADPH-cytochrome P450 reductase